MIDKKYIEISEYKGPGYQPLVDYGQWRVAVLNYIDELLPDKINNMQRHEESDEVFVLLQGSCLLFIGEGDERIEVIQCQEMQPGKLYNIKRGCWHTHTLSRDAMVLIVENLDTNLANSPLIELDAQQRQTLIEYAIDYNLV